MIQQFNRLGNKSLYNIQLDIRIILRWICRICHFMVPESNILNPQIVSPKKHSSSTVITTPPLTASPPIAHSNSSRDHCEKHDWQYVRGTHLLSCAGCVGALQTSQIYTFYNRKRWKRFCNPTQTSAWHLSTSPTPACCF